MTYQANRTPLYIFDLDGTLALNEHRKHLIDRSGGKIDWDAFSMACGNDLPNKPVIKTLQALHISGADILIWSGRGKIAMEITLRWLAQHIGIFSEGAFANRLQMREVNDYTPDHQLKQKWYERMPDAEKRRLVAIFDDRQSVVDMWREIGVPCFQVAQGSF